MVLPAFRQAAYLRGLAQSVSTASEGLIGLEQPLPIPTPENIAAAIATLSALQVESAQEAGDSTRPHPKTDPADLLAHHRASVAFALACAHVGEAAAVLGRVQVLAVQVTQRPQPATDQQAEAYRTALLAARTSLASASRLLRESADHLTGDEPPTASRAAAALAGSRALSLKTTRIRAKPAPAAPVSPKRHAATTVAGRGH